MKIRNYFEMAGLKGKPKKYLYELDDFTIEGETYRYAHWLHPKNVRVEFNEDMLGQLREFINEGDFCIDIGAHVGDSTVPIALAAGKTGQVLALEPNPFIYHVLEKNIRLNRGKLNMESIMAAAATHEGLMEFEYSDSGFCNGGRHEGMSSLKHGHMFKQEVFCIDLQSTLREEYAHCLPRLNFIKVDAEGYDLYILQALGDIIREFRPNIKAEVFRHTSREYRLELLKFFEDLNYKVYKVIAEPVKPGPVLNQENVKEWQHYDIIATPNEG